MDRHNFLLRTVKQKLNKIVVIFRALVNFVWIFSSLLTFNFFIVIAFFCVLRGPCIVLYTLYINIT